MADISIRFPKGAEIGEEIREIEVVPLTEPVSPPVQPPTPAPAVPATPDRELEPV